MEMDIGYQILAWMYIFGVFAVIGGISALIVQIPFVKRWVEKFDD